MAGIGAKPGNTHGFSKGNTLAKESGNQARKRIRKSKLRKTLDKLYALEGQAMENVKASVEGQTVDKSMLDTSKWVISNIMNVTRAAAQDESEINELRLKMDAAEIEEEEKEAEEATPQTRFSLHCLPGSKDLDK